MRNSRRILRIRNKSIKKKIIAVDIKCSIDSDTSVTPLYRRTHQP